MVSVGVKHHTYLLTDMMITYVCISGLCSDCRGQTAEADSLQQQRQDNQVVVVACFFYAQSTNQSKAIIIRARQPGSEVKTQSCS